MNEDRKVSLYKLSEQLQDVQLFSVLITSSKYINPDQQIQFGMKIFNFIRSLRMRTQVLLIQILIMLLLIIVVIFIFLIHLKIINEQLFDTSRMLVNQQNSKTMQITTQKLTHYIQIKEQRYLAAINSINTLYTFPNKTSDFLIEMPEYYLDMNASETLKNFPKFRFGFLNSAYKETQQNQQYQLQFMQLTSLLNTHLFNFQASLEYVYIADTSDAVFSITFPPISRVTSFSFDPRKSQKNIDFLKFIKDNPSQNSAYSKVYLSPMFKEFLSDILLSLISTEQTVDAIVGTFIKIQDNIIINVPYNIYIIDSEDGSIITAGIDQKLISDQKYFIYDTQVSGFDLEDWKEIQEQISNQNGKSNCHFSSQMFCRSNKLYKMDVLISMENLDQQNQTLLIVNNATYQSSLETIFVGITSEVLLTQLDQLYNILFVSGFITIISIIIITVMFRQLQKIIQATNDQIKMRSTHFGRELNFRSTELARMSNGRNIFNNLQQKYEDYLNKIEDSMKKKSEICRLIENFKYSRIQHSIQGRLIQGIKNDFDMLQDNQKPLVIQDILKMQRRLSRTDV